MKSETRTRSLSKTFSYRIVTIALLAGVTFVYTGNAGETTIITVVFNLFGAGIYYLYERLWDDVTWGKTSSLKVARPVLVDIEKLAELQLTKRVSA